MLDGPLIVDREMESGLTDAFEVNLVLLQTLHEFGEDHGQDADCARHWLRAG